MPVYGWTKPLSDGRFSPRLYVGLAQQGVVLFGPKISNREAVDLCSYTTDAVLRSIILLAIACFTKVHVCSSLGMSRNSMLIIIVQQFTKQK